MSNYNRITFKERVRIEAGIYAKESFSKIAKELGRSTSSISREVKENRIMVKSPYACGTDCIYPPSCRKTNLCGDDYCSQRCWTCTKHDCTQYCDRQVSHNCSITRKAPFTCDACSEKNKKKCKYNKYYYIAEKADAKAKATGSEAREGIRLSQEELQTLDEILSPLLLQGQPLSHICNTHADEIKVSERSIYNYYEIILYAFVSTYIFKLRQETSGSKSDIPIMLVIGGRAASGKSNLLAYIDRVLSGRQLLIEQHYIQYKQIEKRDTVGDLFMTDNTYPLLVDEVPTAFFNSKSSNKGEELIKYLSNTLDSKHPVMICTTNTGAFNIPAQVARRIYFIKVDTCFDEKYKGEANSYYDEVMADANNLLFRDFCFRMGERIKANEPLFLEGNFDYLYIAREIFKEYYRMADIDIPEYFPRELYRDYESRGRNMWKTLYVQTKDKFSYEPKKGDRDATLTVNLKDLTTGNKDTQVYMNYLRQDILVEEAGVYVVLRADAFCDWIGVKRISK